jgi:hypothetical protein
MQARHVDRRRLIEQGLDRRTRSDLQTSGKERLPDS